MDDQRFDNLSRIIARSTTRRSTVKGIAAALGGGVFASLFGVRAQRAGAQGTGEPGTVCDNENVCASWKCSNADGRAGVCYCTDPGEPWRGCGCDPNSAGQCGGGSLVCCADAEGGTCTSGSTGCNPTGECTAYPEDACESDTDCCVGTCNGGTCSCTPGLGWEGCACTSGANDQCGGGSLLCCPTGGVPGGPGICTSSMTGCNPTGECTKDPGDDCSGDDECCTGTCLEGVCACLTASEPWLGCDCNVGTQSPCGGTTNVCCPTGTG